jgi:hypothetical protein
MLKHLAHRISAAFLAFFCCVLPGFSSVTLYVDQNDMHASDSNPGTSTLPLKTVQRALDLAQAGDTVTIRPGVYREYLSAKHSGVPGSPIIVQGVRGPNGEWRTIVDPSIDASVGWIAAPEAGPYVYKKSDIGFVPGGMVLDNKLICRIRNAVMAANPTEITHVQGAFPGTVVINNGFDLLNFPADAYVNLTSVYGSLTQVKFWDSIEALWGAKDGVTYLRFRDGRNPNGLPLRIVDNGVFEWSALKPAILVSGQSYLTFRDLRVRNAFTGAQLRGSAHHIIIERNRITGGAARIRIIESAHDNLIQQNDLSLEFFGTSDFGPWGGGTEYFHGLRQHTYAAFKYIYGSNSSNDEGISLDGSGPGNEIFDNDVHDGLLGIGAGLGTPDGNIHHNRVRNMSSVGITLGRYATKQHVYDNDLQNSNINIRFNELNQPGQTERLLYVYRNKLCEPKGVGNNMFMHFLSGTQSPLPEVWIYHNSMRGGGYGIYFNAYADDNGGLPHAYIFNNLFSSIPLGVSVAFYSNASMLGAFDYNLIGTPVKWSAGALAGGHNKTLTSTLWDDSLPCAWNITKDSPAVDAALDVSQDFMLANQTFTPRPDLAGITIAGAGPDMGAVEYALTPLPPDNLEMK